MSISLVILLFFSPLPFPCILSFRKQARPFGIMTDVTACIPCVLTVFDRTTLFVCIVGQPIMVDTVSRCVIHPIREGCVLPTLVELVPVLREEDDIVTIRAPFDWWYRSDIEVYSATGLDAGTLARIDGKRRVLLVREEVDEEKSPIDDGCVKGVCKRNH
jgi:hypothetical protein